MKYTISVLTENHPGVLSRISGLFARRAFNIDSLAVGPTESPTVSRITIVVDGNEYTVEQVEKQLNKLIDTIKVKTLGETGEFVQRELMLVKVNVPADKRGEVIDIVKIMGASIIDISKTTLTIEITSNTQQVELLLELLSPYGIKEAVRTGAIAIEKGADTITAKSK